MLFILCWKTDTCWVVGFFNSDVAKTSSISNFHWDRAAFSSELLQARAVLLFGSYWGQVFFFSSNSQTKRTKSAAFTPHFLNQGLQYYYHMYQVFPNGPQINTTFVYFQGQHLLVKVLSYMCEVSLCTCSGFWTSLIGSDIGTHVYHDKASGSGNI